MISGDAQHFGEHSGECEGRTTPKLLKSFEPNTARFMSVAFWSLRQVMSSSNTFERKRTP